MKYTGLARTCQECKRSENLNTSRIQCLCIFIAIGNPRGENNTSVMFGFSQLEHVTELVYEGEFGWQPYSKLFSRNINLLTIILYMFYKIKFICDKHQFFHQLTPMYIHTYIYGNGD